MVDEKHVTGVIAVPYQFRERELYILLLHRKKSEKNIWVGWEFPKGSLDGKTTNQAIERELQQEANIVKSRIRPINYRGRHHTFEYTFYESPEKMIRRLMYVFSVEVEKTEDIRVNGKEHDRSIWRKYRDAFRYLKKRNMRRSLSIVKKVITGNLHHY